MSKPNDNLSRELHRLDPVEPGELGRAADSAEAAALLERIVATELGAAPAPTPRGARPRTARRRPTRRRAPRLALSAAVAVAAAALILVFALSTGGGGDDDLAVVLDRAAATAAAQPPSSAAEPYTYLKTREVSVDTNGADRRSWKVLQSTTREEWVTRNGAGRLRIVDGPSRFVDSGDRAEWEGAGEPQFLTLGFGRRTEDRWLDAGMLRATVEELPTDPAMLVARLRAQAEVQHGETPVNAATLQLIAEYLRDPGASPRYRQALYEAARHVPGIEYLGARTDPAGRRGIAVGVTDSHAGTPAVYALIFDPATAQVLATETTPVPGRGAGEAGGPRLLRARVYLESRGTGSLTGNGGAWLDGFEPPTAADAGRANLVYRIPDLGSS